MSMDRRNFLRGMFAGVTSAGVIVAATPAEIEAFASPLVKDSPVMLDVPQPAAALPPGAGEHLYNSRGEVVAIIRSLECSIDRVDCTLPGDTWRRFSPGMTRISIHAIGIGTIERVRDGAGSLGFELRGRRE